jgi:hypothetical protein
VQVTAGGEGHRLGRTRLEPIVVAERVRVQELALQEIREGLDVRVWVHRPVGARLDAVVVDTRWAPTPI